MKSRYYIVLLLLCLVGGLQAAERNDSTIWQGINLKVDIGTPILETALSSAKVQSYEIALNADLKHRFFPTLELGYAQADVSAAGGIFSGKGGYGRIGIDLSALKKGRKENMLLVGLRVGTALQQAGMNEIKVSDPYWQLYPATSYPASLRCDAWGEVVAGVQVQVYKRFHMGWFVRLKLLMTRGKEGDITAHYIPGFGYRQDTNFGFNYYLGWTL
ncbi:MAG: DUF6048 family protein [Paludibacter sp.]|nr:DUF6048 family protein [Bacteroidales bacterium]MCM1069662.1 DUF6048 family protein [Prevotella sp.]MCM1354308.1 DUF6048 family protein [Bacteroides sp.]MCM1443153.1 DUF6048 family protein [Muribaculum sp.]MCM1482388.1 DUF6048 family protein [Paludibacter sp.]